MTDLFPGPESLPDQGELGGQPDVPAALPRDDAEEIASDTWSGGTAAQVNITPGLLDESTARSGELPAGPGTAAEAEMASELLAAPSFAVSQTAGQDQRGLLVTDTEAVDDSSTGRQDNGEGTEPQAVPDGDNLPIADSRIEPLGEVALRTTTEPGAQEATGATGTVTVGATGGPDANKRGDGEETPEEPGGSEAPQSDIPPDVDQPDEQGPEGEAAAGSDDGPGDGSNGGSTAVGEGGEDDAFRQILRELGVTEPQEAQETSEILESARLTSLLDPENPTGISWDMEIPPGLTALDSDRVQVNTAVMRESMLRTGVDRLVVAVRESESTLLPVRLANGLVIPRSELHQADEKQLIFSLAFPGETDDVQHFEQLRRLGLDRSVVIAVEGGGLEEWIGNLSRKQYAGDENAYTRAYADLFDSVAKRALYWAERHRITRDQNDPIVGRGELVRQRLSLARHRATWGTIVGYREAE